MTVQENHLVKVFCFFLIAAAIFLFWPEEVWAQVVINELLPHPAEGSDWVELYNTSDQGVDLNDWVIDDEGTETNMFELKETTIDAHGFLVFGVDNRLNNGGDTVYLIDNQGVTVDEYQYDDDPGPNISIGRVPDGGNWGTCSQITPGSENQCLVPTPTPTPTSSPTPTPTPNPTSTPKSPTATPTSKLDTPTSTPTVKSTPTGTPKSTGSTLTPTSEKILGEEEAEKDFYPLEATGEGEENQEANSAGGRKKVLPFVFLGFGLVFLFGAGFYFWYTQIR